MQQRFNCSSEPLELLVGCGDCGFLDFALRPYDNGDFVWRAYLAPKAAFGVSLHGNGEPRAILNTLGVLETAHLMSRSALPPLAIGPVVSNEFQYS